MQWDSQRFERAVTTAFRFLVDEYGFTHGPLRDEAIERWVRYEKEGTEVVVQQELGSGLFVTLYAPAVEVPGWGRTFGLHELEQEMQRLGHYQPVPAAPATVEESAAILAGILRKIGKDVLNGDFSLLFARQRRHRAAMGKGRA
jgi:hypothetical protein